MDSATTAILYPMLTLVGWTQAVLGLIPWRRVRAARAGQVTPEDFRYGESPRVPPAVSLANRNYMNLLELPVLFYVVSLTYYVTGLADGLVLAVAWLYVGLRLVHSLVHVSYNAVMHRLACFAASNLALLVLWVVLVARL